MVTKQNILNMIDFAEKNGETISTKTHAVFIANDVEVDQEFTDLEIVVLQDVPDGSIFISQKPAN